MPQLTKIDKMTQKTAVLASQIYEIKNNDVISKLSTVVPTLVTEEYRLPHKGLNLKIKNKINTESDQAKM